MSGYDWRIMNQIKDEMGTIKNIASQIGIDPMAIAGAIAEEHEWFGAKDVVYEFFFDVGTVFKAQEEFEEDYKNGNYGVWDMPLGMGSVRVSTAITLLKSYLYTTRSAGLDVANNEIYQLLITYENDFSKMCSDMGDTSKPIALIMTALMLKKAEEFFSDTLPQQPKPELISQDYFNMQLGVKGVTKLAWDLLGQHEKNALMITFFNKGWGNTSKNIIPAITAKPTGHIYGLSDTYTFPQYFPQPSGGDLGSQDTFYVGTIKGVGRIYQQTFVDTYSKQAAAKLYTTKTLITSADLLNDRVLPLKLQRKLCLMEKHLWKEKVDNLN